MPPARRDFVVDSSRLAVAGPLAVPIARLLTVFAHLTLVAVAAAASGCAGNGEASDGRAPEATAPPAGSDSDVDAGEWRSLFDGVSLDGWRGYHSPEPPDGWRVDDGTLHRGDGGGDIMTAEAFGDFELSLEWRVARGANSGIFYRAATGLDHIFMSAPEMQVLDDAGHADGGDPLTSAGANFGLHPAPRGVVRPAGEWNEARILVDGNHVEHWLNGVKVVEYELGSPEWRQLVAESKFAQWPDYGAAPRGHIGLQDHGDPVWYRNIRIRELD